MRVKKEMLITAFPTTHAAIKTEEKAALSDISGRLIPLPGSVKAGCGLAFCCEPQLKERLENMLQTENIPFELMKVTPIFVKEE